MLSQKYSSKAIQLISINSFGKIVLHAEAAAFLRTLAPPISLVTLAGPMRTGKTFLMQQIVSQGGLFTEGRTAGLWIWSKPMLAYNQEGRIASILLLDSQGFQPYGSKNDQTLIALLLLLANCLLYNSAGPIDSLSFRELETLMAVARQLKDKNCDFHWLLRDFDPTLVDPMGADITGHQYMENQLMAADSFAEKTVSSLREIFPNRSCHCFVKPTPEAIQQPPQFLKQVIELRKCLNGVPSLNLQGAAIVAVVQAYIDSLNSGDSLAKAEMEGRDCRMRLECLARLGEELKGLQQRQSSNQIEDLDEQLGEIRTQLKEYYKQRMCSHRQIQDLDEQLNEIIQDFQELNERPRTPVVSREIIRLNVPKQDKMVRLSLNISDSDKDRMDFDSRARFDSRPNLPLTSIGRINTDKNLHSKMEEYQAKIYRYQLEANCSRRQLQGLKDEYDESRRELDCKTDQIEQLIERIAQLQRQYEAKFQQQDEQLEELKKAKIMVESQLAKVKVLHEEKVTYLEEQLLELGEQREEQLRLKEEKYRAKLGECLKEIQDLKKSHEEELMHLKQLYQQSHDQLSDSKHQQSTDTFYKEMREQMQQLESLKEQLERQRFSSNQKDEAIISLKKQLEAREELNKDSLEQAAKRAKDAERHLQDMFNAKLNAKNALIEELQQRINEISNSNQDSLNRIISQNNRLLAELEQKDRKLTIFSTTSQQTSREMGKLKEELQEFEHSIQTITENLKKKEQSSVLQQQKIEQLSREKQELTEALQKKQQDLEEVQCEVSELKGQVSILQETHQFEVARLKETYETQMAEFRNLFQADKQRLQAKLKDLQNVAQIGRRVREDYEELQHESAVTEFQLRQALDERDRQLDSTKACLKELTQEYEGLSTKNSELLASLLKVREESILSCEQAAESEKRVKEQLQVMLEKSVEASREKEKVIATLRQQLEKEVKSNTVKTQTYNRQMEQLQAKLKNLQLQYTRQSAKTKQQLEESQKKVSQLSQKVALLNHKISLQEQSLTFKAESKNIEIGKLTEKLKSIQSKSVQSNTLATIYQEQLKQEQQEVARLQRLLAAFYKEKQVALSNLQDLENRARMSDRKYEAHLNLFQEKLKEKKQECIELRERLEQYREDYQNLHQIKTTLERSLQKESLLLQYKQQIAAHRAH